MLWICATYSFHGLFFGSEKCVCLTAFKSWSGFYFGNVDEEDVDPDVTERELAGPRGDQRAAPE